MRCSGCDCVWCYDSVAEGEKWRFEARLGQSVSVSVDGSSVGLSGTAAVAVHCQAAAALLSADYSTSSIHSCTRLKVSTLCQTTQHQHHRAICSAPITVENEHKRYNMLR